MYKTFFCALTLCALWSCSKNNPNNSSPIVGAWKGYSTQSTQTQSISQLNLVFNVLSNGGYNVYENGTFVDTGTYLFNSKTLQLTSFTYYNQFDCVALTTDSIVSLISTELVVNCQGSSIGYIYACPTFYGNMTFTK